MQSRKKYKSHLKEPRTEKLKELISENKPKFVIFYSSTKTYLEYWYKIIGADKTNFEIVTHGNLNAKFYKSDKTLYVIIYHPAARGVSNAYYKVVSEKMKEYSTAIKV